MNEENAYFLQECMVAMTAKGINKSGYITGPNTTCQSIEISAASNTPPWDKKSNGSGHMLMSIIHRSVFFR